MNFDDQLHRYFGVRDVDALTPDALEAGLERMRVDFGLETDGRRRFALWSLMFLLGAAPDLDEAFEDPADRDAARDFMEMMERAGGDE
ncbi:hypothetical protein Sj15T_23820 [Sphingobium sp. TA15]|uniref:Uncharacterized protein n=1 Tax=Sphingobium indicum (strain DSM 16413 / CCM 7287 / MTCC 6362 / UT26 / NBRC 101211 / UT26S) TaxID=452662 RepID=D4Z5U2_SPHIU|nr:hypothetical protein [Sphingobium indicum]BAI97974.1 hypothetical protein SJA_C1-31400 [Sphingobium indicum UT26S]BDD67361.1 hypothetical protein Sj15T_23820 [Sphingobium sp. TA15]